MWPVARGADCGRAVESTTVNRRMSSRKVSLSSTFLLLAAGGTAACDAGNDYHREGFYCADANGVVVDEDLCDQNRYYGGHVPYYIWHSPSYVSGWPIGYRLPSGGSRF